MEEEKQLFFVELRNPVQVRRNLLEAQKEIVESLQRYENIKFIRNKKIESIEKLRKDIKELIKLISNFKTVLPSAKIKEAQMIVKEVMRPKKRKKKSAKKKKAVKHKVQSQEEIKPMSELEKLEAELSAIESKLGSLK